MCEYWLFYSTNDELDKILFFEFDKQIERISIDAEEIIQIQVSENEVGNMVYIVSSIFSWPSAKKGEIIRWMCVKCMLDTRRSIVYCMRIDWLVAACRGK